MFKCVRVWFLCEQNIFFFFFFSFENDANLNKSVLDVCECVYLSE